MGDTVEQLSAAFAPFRTGLRADGADLRVVEASDDKAVVELVVGPETCLECILPKEHIENVLLVVGREAHPELTEVVLLDQREAQ